jgi:putative restriction endonuclease
MTNDKAFDRGAISVSDEHRILISSRIYGNAGLESWFLAIHGRQLRTPSRREAASNKDFLAWHRKEVFRGEGRD